VREHDPHFISNPTPLSRVIYCLIIINIRLYTVMPVRDEKVESE